MNPKRVLVIDDESAVRDAFDLALEDSEYEVNLAGSGEDGLACAKQCAPDLVFLDLKMPGMDGVETLKRLRDNGSDAKIVIVTAFSGDFYQKLRAADGAGLSFELLQKPVGHEQIADIARRMLE